MDKDNIFNNIDEYHSLLSADIQKQLEQLRQTIRQAAPFATETISYGMSAFKQNRVLVYYAAHKKLIGFYPTASPIVKLADELASYNTSKGAIQFPIDQPLPLSLIQEIVKFRVDEDAARAK